jgi:hypothetical protein
MPDATVQIIYLLSLSLALSLSLSLSLSHTHTHILFAWILQLKFSMLLSYTRVIGAIVWLY